MLAGRGFGKTRAGAEWISQMARCPSASLGSSGPVQIALVAANPDEARRVMVEGRSGLLAVATPWERARMRWEPSRRRLRFASGAQAFIYSGAHADGLRGPEHHFAWCDELAKWEQAQGAWDNLMLGLRLGTRPRALVTTTPRPIALLKEMIGDDATVQTGGATAANPHLGERFVAAMERKHGGTTLGRQELQGELIDDLEGSLWPRALLQASRSGALAGAMRRVVIGVDPPAGVGRDACGIVAVGVDGDEIAHVLGDHSAAGLSPEGWARKVAAAAELHGAQSVVAEANIGGKMVESVLRGAGIALPVRLVHASEGKVARAAPVAALFESGRAKLAGRFAALEDELAGLTWSGEYRGPGRSPDRADAMVWAMTELMLGPPARAPRIRLL
jgi:phage terminase large subunit-like protein